MLLPSSYSVTMLVCTTDFHIVLGLVPVVGFRPDSLLATTEYWYSVKLWTGEGTKRMSFVRIRIKQKGMCAE